MALTRRAFGRLAATGSLGFLCGCHHNALIDRSQLNYIPDAWMARISGMMWENLQSSGGVVDDYRVNRAVRRVGRRIVDASGLTNVDWDYIVLANPQPNAFVLPGGKIAVFTGIFRFARTEAQLAAVLGHEAGHVAARHGAERLSQQVAVNVSAIAIQVYLWNRVGFLARRALAAAYGLGATYGVLLPFSRRHELEADELGLTYMARAGYDPRAALGFWQNMLNAQDLPGAPNAFLSTHPATEDRIALLHNRMPDALGIFRRG